MLGRGFHIGACVINLVPFCRLGHINKQKDPAKFANRGMRDVGPPDGNQRVHSTWAGYRDDDRADDPVNGKKGVVRDVGPPDGK